MSLSNIKLWNATPAQNNSAPPTGAPEGATAVNALNDILREMMAMVRRWWEDPAYTCLGDDATYVSATQFQVPGDQSAQYHDNRPVRIVGTLTTTVYGRITTSSVSTNTTVTVELDSGTLQNEALTVSLGHPVTGQAIPAEAVRGLEVFAPGMMMDFGGATAPPGWLLCNGAPVSRTTYADLFAVIGDTYGTGDGSTTFNVPDLQGRASLGAGTGDTAEGGGSGTARARGQKVGAETHTQTEAEIASHAHRLRPDPDNITALTNLAGPTGFGAGSNQGQQIILTESAGGGSPMNNMAPALVVSKIIKT